MAKVQVRPGAKKQGSKSPTTASRKQLASKGQAMKDNSFPTPNRDYLERAIRSIGRAPASKRPALKAYLRRRARALGATDLLKKGALSMSNADVEALELAAAAAPTVVTPPHLVPGARNKLTSKGGTPAVKGAVKAKGTKGTKPGKEDADGDFDGDTAADVAAKKKLGLKNKQALVVYQRAIARKVAPRVALQAAKKVDQRLGDPKSKTAKLANNPKA